MASTLGTLLSSQEPDAPRRPSPPRENRIRGNFPTITRNQANLQPVPDQASGATHPQQAPAASRPRRPPRPGDRKNSTPPLHEQANPPPLQHGTRCPATRSAQHGTRPALTRRRGARVHDREVARSAGVSPCGRISALLQADMRPQRTSSRGLLDDERPPLDRGREQLAGLERVDLGYGRAGGFRSGTTMGVAPVAQGAALSGEVWRHINEPAYRLPGKSPARRH